MLAEEAWLDEEVDVAVAAAAAVVAMAAVATACLDVVGYAARDGLPGAKARAGDEVDGSGDVEAKLEEP